ncbi:MAG: electron transporter SenC [Gammaproteobacteria bacterium BRH_c0]|nr:MAG: electron transporter SenC [Gammaproteobacteria bacterium BRH_c0]
MTPKRKIWITVAVCVAFSLLMLVGLMNKLSAPRMLTSYEMREYGAMLLEKPRRFSDFQLVTHSGEAFTKSSLEGKWTLIFFGFSHCPDICPTTLATLNRLVAALKDGEQKDIQVVMLTVDPERDTPEKLAQYVPYFNKDFIGVTGNQYQILNVATQLSVVYTKAPLKGDDYTMDHSSNVVIINPKGDYHGFFRPPFEEGAMRVAWRSMAADFPD